MTQIQIFIVLVVIRWYFKLSKYSNAEFKAQWYKAWDEYTLDQKIYSLFLGFLTIISHIFLWIVSGWILLYVNSFLEKI